MPRGSSSFRAIKDKFSLTHFDCLRDFIRPYLAEGKVGRLFGQNYQNHLRLGGLSLFD